MPIDVFSQHKFLSPTAVYRATVILIKRQWLYLNWEGYPANSLAILEPQDIEISKNYVVQERRVTDFIAHKIVKGFRWVINSI